MRQKHTAETQICVFVGKIFIVLLYWLPVHFGQVCYTLVEKYLLEGLIGGDFQFLVVKIPKGTVVLTELKPW